MSRPPKHRWVENIPSITYFKPAGIPLKHLLEINLTVDEVEAIRLKDLEGLEQEECAEKMGISRPTFHRIINNARNKIAHALIQGKAIRIKGGNFRLVGQPLTCSRCGQTWKLVPGNEKMQCPRCQFKVQYPSAHNGNRQRNRHHGPPLKP